jgi:hypothetical protein
LKAIDPNLELRFSEPAGCSWCIAAASGTEGKAPYLVGAYPELDHRIVTRLRHVASESYDLAAELERREEQARRDDAHGAQRGVRGGRRAPRPRDQKGLRQQVARFRAGRGGGAVPRRGRERGRVPCRRGAVSRGSSRRRGWVVTFADIVAEAMQDSFNTARYTDRVKRWVNEGQGLFAREVDVRNLEVSAVLAVAAGANSVATPSDFLRGRSLFVVSRTGEASHGPATRVRHVQHVEDSAGR